MDVLGGGPMAELGEEFPVAGEGELRLIAETHECLLAAERARATRPRLDLVGGHRPGVGVVRILPERAVSAAVAAEVRDRQEGFPRVSDRPPPGTVAAPGGGLEQRRHGLHGVEQRRGLVARQIEAGERFTERLGQCERHGGTGWQLSEGSECVKVRLCGGFGRATGRSGGRTPRREPGSAPAAGAARGRSHTRRGR